MREVGGKNVFVLRESDPLVDIGNITFVGGVTGEGDFGNSAGIGRRWAKDFAASPWSRSWGEE